MVLICEDLARCGVVLIPPSSENCFQLLTDIERRLQVRPMNSPPLEKDTLSHISNLDARECAILLNQTQVSIASLAYFWSFRAREGRIVHHRFLPGTNSSVLLQFCIDDRIKKFEAFWHTMFPRLQASNDC